MSIKPPIRTITLGIEERHPLSPSTVKLAGSILNRSRDLYHTDGYEVQTLRISTRSVLEDLAGWKVGELLEYAQELHALVVDARLDFCSLGTAQAIIPLDRAALLADMLIGREELSATVQIAAREGGIRYQAIPVAASIIKRLSNETALGFGNFQFAAIANVPPGFPFFPAAYHTGPASLAVGIQGADFVADAVRQDPSPERVVPRVRHALGEHAGPVARIAAQAATVAGVLFGGIDLSPAPLGKASIGAAIESMVLGPVGSPGTLAAAGALTTAIQSTGLPTCGYNGLMLPVLEDEVLGARWTDGSIDVHKLLCYSAVCGTGLDMPPLPGSTSESQIARLLLDLATLAVRLGKPLSARLMPVPGLHDGDVTSFTSRYLTNTAVRRLSAFADGEG